MKKRLNLINIYFGVIFLIFQLIIAFGIFSDGGLNYPMTKGDYLARGGNSFDYFFGYRLYTCLDTGIYARIEDKVIRFVSAEIPILLITLLWLAGVAFPKVDKGSGEMVIRYKKNIFVIITTSISIYYLYYSFVYVTQFWLE